MALKKSGDKGITSLPNGIRMSKTSIYFDLLGDFEELECHINTSKCLWKEVLDTKVDTHLYDYWKDYRILDEIKSFIKSITKCIGNPPWHEIKPLKGDTENTINTWINSYGINHFKIVDIETLIERYKLLCIITKTEIITPLICAINHCTAITRRCERNYLKFLGSDLLFYGVYEMVDDQFNNIQKLLNRLSEFFSVVSNFISYCIEIEE